MTTINPAWVSAAYQPPQANLPKISPEGGVQAQTPQKNTAPEQTSNPVSSSNLVPLSSSMMSELMQMNEEASTEKTNAGDKFRDTVDELSSPRQPINPKEEKEEKPVQEHLTLGEVSAQLAQEGSGTVQTDSLSYQMSNPRSNG